MLHARSTHSCSRQCSHWRCPLLSGSSSWLLPSWALQGLRGRRFQRLRSHSISSSFHGAPPASKRSTWRGLERPAHDRAKLKAALTQLLIWVATTALVLKDWMSDATQCNQVLCEHVQKLHTSNGKVGVARLAISTVQSFRRAPRATLGRAWDCIRSKQLAVLLKSRVPMPEDLVRAFFGLACRGSGSNA